MKRGGRRHCQEGSAALDEQAGWDGSNAATNRSINQDGKGNIVLLCIVCSGRRENRQIMGDLCQRCGGQLPLLPAAGTNPASWSRELVDKVWAQGSFNRSPPAPALACIKRTIQKIVCGVVHDQLTVEADAHLLGLALPPAPFFQHPNGSQWQLRQRLPLLPPPRCLQVGLAPAQ